MWGKNWRESIWATLEQPWDMVVIGGGITGAGILREAVRLKLRVLLVEQRDFSWGTSSRSSKLVHGGLRYLATGQVGLTLASVRERERLLSEGPGLIAPLGFLMATYKGDHPGRLTYAAGLAAYDLMAQRWTHRRYKADEFQMLAPYIRPDHLLGGFRYGDAQTDDSRLTLRVIREAVAAGGVALNYVTAQQVIHENGEVVGVRLYDEFAQRSAEVRARVVVNATGAWADRLREQVGGKGVIRPLRGSHLVFPAWRLPVAQAVSFLHPADRRPVFVFPWEGATLVGTTDADHDQPLNEEPRISPEEVSYLMAAVEFQFPACELTLDDIVATFAGVRPVIGTGKTDPSKESREHIVWHEHGLLTVTGGKLTTFRLIAQDAIHAVRDRLPDLPLVDDQSSVLNPIPRDLPGAGSLDEGLRCRLLGRYAADAAALIEAARPGELELIPGTQTLWAELRWAARAEGVVHLDGLLLRRVRLGLLLPNGGESLLPRIRALCQPELGWDDARWEAEATAYLALWHAHYSLPDHAAIPEWKSEFRSSQVAAQDRRPGPSLKAILTLAALVGVLWRVRRHHRRGR